MNHPSGSNAGRTCRQFCLVSGHRVHMADLSLALEAGREPLVALAREQGIAALAITNTHHFAALWPETEALAERGLVGFAFVAAMSYVAPAGGTKPLYGTNPTSFAWPSGEGRPPLVFDQASSARAARS